MTEPMARPVGIGGDPDTTAKILTGNRRLRRLVYAVTALMVVAGLVVSGATVAALGQLTQQGHDIQALIAADRQDRATRGQRSADTIRGAINTLDKSFTANDEADAARTEQLRADLVAQLEAIEARLAALEASRTSSASPSASQEPGRTTTGTTTSRAPLVPLPRRQAPDPPATATTPTTRPSPILVPPRDDSCDSLVGGVLPCIID